MKEDRTELNDLAEVETEKVKTFEGMFQSWADRVGVVPFDQLTNRKNR
jgi:hypothetical protein